MVDHSPSQDPNRKEMLITTSMELIDDNQNTVAIYEIVRDSKDTLLELTDLEKPHEVQNVISPFLIAFGPRYRMGSAKMNWLDTPYSPGKNAIIMGFLFRWVEPRVSKYDGIS